MQEQRIDSLYDRLNNDMTSYLTNYKHIIDKYKSNYILNNPNVLYQEKVKEIHHIISKLELLNPLGLLKKGYSIDNINIAIETEI